MASSRGFAKNLRENRPHVQNMIHQAFRIQARTKSSAWDQNKQCAVFIGCSGNVRAGQTVAFRRGQRFLWAVNVGTTCSSFALQINGCEFIDFVAETVNSSYSSAIIPLGGVQAGATPSPLKQRTSRSCCGSSLREDVQPVGLADQSRPKSARLTGSRSLSTAVSEGSAK
jgi:hypothetical protein